MKKKVVGERSKKVKITSTAQNPTSQVALVPVNPVFAKHRFRGDPKAGDSATAWRPLRYLIGSVHGWLGGFGFAAPALQLADRDAGRLAGTARGGYLGCNNDPPPGHPLLWQGYTEFQFMCLGFTLPAKNEIAQCITIPD